MFIYRSNTKYFSPAGPSFANKSDTNKGGSGGGGGGGGGGGNNNHASSSHHNSQTLNSTNVISQNTNTSISKNSNDFKQKIDRMVGFCFFYSHT